MQQAQTFPGPHVASKEISRQLSALWSQHVNWTKSLIVSSVMNLPDVNFVTKRVMKNAMDFITFFLPYYGNEASFAAGNLLREHLEIAAKIIDAGKANNVQAGNDLMVKWTANANNLAIVFSRMFSSWAYDTIKNMLNEHIRLTQIEITSYIQRQYDQFIQTFDEIDKQAMIMAHFSADGMIRQFKII